jgi:hypothetical protein
VQIRGEDVGVVNSDWKLDEDIGISEIRLLESSSETGQYKGQSSTDQITERTVLR